jgi:hypothetical protein
MLVLNLATPSGRTPNERFKSEAFHSRLVNVFTEVAVEVEV